VHRLDAPVLARRFERELRVDPERRYVQPLFPLLTAFPSIATTPPPALAAAIPATFLRQAAPAGLSFECASLKVCKPPAQVSGTSASIVELVLALDRCQPGVCTLAHLHTFTLRAFDFFKPDDPGGVRHFFQMRKPWDLQAGG